MKVFIFSPTHRPTCDIFAPPFSFKSKTSTYRRGRETTFPIYTPGGNPKLVPYEACIFAKWLHFRPTGPHMCGGICNQVFPVRYTLLFEREVNLLLYESLWLDVYTLLTFYSVKMPSRTRVSAKLQTYILHDKMQNAVFSASIWNVSRSGRESLRAPQNGSSVSPGPFRAS